MCTVKSFEKILTASSEKIDIDIEQYTELARAFDDLDGKYLRRVFMGGIADADMKALRNLPDFDRAVDGVMESMRRMGGEYDLFDDASLRLQAENFVEKQVSLSIRSSV